MCHPAARVLALHALLALPALLTAAPGIQAPHAPWRTLQTAHYRIHYPPLLSAWALEVAGEIEGIHARVTALVGYESPVPVQVLLLDPMEEANGMAVPLLAAPHVTLWRTEPRSDNLHLDTLPSWAELLLSHELTHIHHLMRPARKPQGPPSAFAWPFGPLVLKCPRWVTEGYATLAEGRITASGRPHGPLRATLLRQWAVAGKLPSYRDLDASPAFMGSGMAYQVGSAYLEWLERTPQAPPEGLQRFWKQLASPRGRRFEAAFTATFGFTPQDGYQRFQAELTHDALEWEARLGSQGLRQGELWARPPGAVADLAVSPDGTRLLTSLDRAGAGGLRIWDLAQPPKAPGKPDAAAESFNGAQDLPAEFQPPKLRASLPVLDGRMPREAQWVDAGTILFQLKHPDGEGVLHRRPALWHLDGGVETAPANVPAPRWRTLEPVHRRRLWVLEMDGQTVPLPGEAAGRAFVDEGRHQILAACAWEGIWNLVRVPYGTEGGSLRFGPAQRLTRTVSAAWNPAPTPDGKELYFLSLDARGTEIRRLDLTLPPLETAPACEPRLLTQATVMPPAPGPSPLPAPIPPPPSRPSRACENLNNHLAFATALAPSGKSFQLGAAGEDLLGRLSWQMLAGFGDGAGPRGLNLATSSTAWPWKPSLTLFSALERPSLQALAPAARDRERRGLEAALEYDHRAEPLLWTSPVLAWERVQSLSPEEPDALRTRSLAGLRSGLEARWGRGPWLLTLRPALDLYAGSTQSRVLGSSHGWTAARAELALRLDTPLTVFSLQGAGGRFGGESGEAFHLGGLTTSLVPLSLDLNRLEQPALPAYAAEGDRFLHYRLAAGGPFKAYLEGHALWNGGQERMAFQRVLGLTYVLALQGSAGEQVSRKLKLSLGLHRVLDGPLRDRTVGTLSLVLRP